MTFFKKAMNYLGLGPDDAYDDYDAPMEPERPNGRAARPGYGPDPLDSGTVRTVPARPVAREPVGGRGPVPREDLDQPAVTVRARIGSAVRTVPASGAPPKPHTVRPTRFDHAQEVADKFKEGQPVIVNLQDVERDLQRRIIDFCAGLAYALDGTMEKVGHGMYLLTPANVQVSPEDRQLISGRGYDD
jgi:cell division inhibitor SepF